ncbi:MAG TPA: AAA family ATPase [Rubrivivax sp.]|nr:AAA family ATPase [Burkholderiales bacterium]HNT39415.1 AAA family ATPase [Rubrivivax sp.]
MYAAFFGLQREAFSIAPDPRFLHLSEGHREALAHLLYGLQGGGGFVLLTGGVGTGKTTVCRCFLEQVPEGCRVAYLYNPLLTPLELLQTVCEEFGVGVDTSSLDSEPPASTKACVDALNRFLLDCHARGEQCLLVVDEAQGLAPELLELLRLLTNLETAERKLLQIVLIGQPELRALLARPDLEQLAQRVIARVHLEPLDAAGTADYVRHRLGVAGLQGPLPFSEGALQAIHRRSGGVPRRINLLCQRALLGAYGRGLRTVDAATVRQAAREVFEGEHGGRRPPWRLPALAALLVAGAGAAWWGWRDAGQGTAPAAAVASIAPAGGAASAARTLAAGEAPAPFAEEGAASAALAAAWDLEATGERDPCRRARAHGLACWEGSVDLALLRRLDRPLLLVLQDGGLVLLRALGEDAAVVEGAQGPQQLPLSSLQSHWRGKLIAWWRPPPGDEREWILGRLLALQGPETAVGARAPQDEILRRRVFAFQLGQGLPLDGLAGPLTLMQLNRASGVAEPRLDPPS